MSTRVTIENHENGEGREIEILRVKRWASGIIQETELLDSQRAIPGQRVTLNTDAYDALVISEV